MAQQTVYPNGTADVTVPYGDSIIVANYGSSECIISYGTGPNNFPQVFYEQQRLSNGEVTLGTFATVQDVRIEAGANQVFFNVATSPVITVATGRVVKQGAPTAETVSATLTAADILAYIITVNEGAAGASALQLPLATAMDTALPDFTADDAFEFSLINISTVAAEDASITTNTGWTLVGSMAVQSNDADTSKSAGRFLARKTAAGAWTLYRLS